MTQVQRLTVPAGKLFCLSRGEYSDYGYSGHFLALVDLSPAMLREVEAECKAAQKSENANSAWGDESAYGADDKFIPALVQRGWVMDIDCVEIHTGSYGELDLS